METRGEQDTTARQRAADDLERAHHLAGRAREEARRLADIAEQACRVADAAMGFAREAARAAEAAQAAERDAVQAWVGVCGTWGAKVATPDPGPAKSIQHAWIGRDPA